MLIDFHKKFKKRYKKLRETEQMKCDKQIVIFEKEPFHPILNNHPLHGKYRGYRSINITGDIRAVYKEKNGSAIFVDIGTHHELFGS